MDIRKLEVIRIGLTLAEAAELQEFFENTALAQVPSGVVDDLYDKLQEILEDGEKAND